MYKKIIVIIILSFFFILSCAKNNPNNPNSSESGNVSDGGDTGGSTGDGGNTGDGGQTQSPLAKYAGAWKDGYKVYVIGEEGYFIYTYQTYWFKTTYKYKQAILEMTLDFTDENNCKFNFKFTYTDGSGGFYPGTLVNYTKNK